jgi:hypothetical protein
MDGGNTLSVLFVKDFITSSSVFTVGLIQPVSH